MGTCQSEYRRFAGAWGWVLLGVVCAVFALVAALFMAGAAYSASEPNASGYEFTDPSTGIVYEVTAPADNSAAGEVELVSGASFTGSALNVGTVADSGYTYVVTAVHYSAFEGNSSLQSVTFTRDLTAVSEGKRDETTSRRRAVGTRAFANCPNLVSVSFSCDRVNGIGNEAFYECGKLTSITFKEGMEIFGQGYAFGIGARAFASTAVTSLKIPAITCAKRTGDYYFAYDHDYEAFNEDRDLSGYMGCWHDKLSYFGIESRGICEGAFANTPLEKITFAAGNERGLFAYWSADGAGLRYLTSLKSVVYEAAQPYYGNPAGSLRNGQAVDLWGLGDDDEEGTQVAEPTFYYAVDFYTSKDSADAADGAGSGRLSRVEFAAGTSTGDIQAANSSKLAGQIYPTASDYATKAADGSIPSADAAAAAAQAAGIAGYEDASSHSWVWMLGNTQSRRAGLTDSCTAWPVHADSLEGARVSTVTDGADQIATMQLLCDQNLSRPVMQNSPFDYQRYFAADSVYMFDEDSIKSYAALGQSNLQVGKTPWFTLNSRGLAGLMGQMSFYDAAGNELDPLDETKFAVSFKTYNAKTGALETTALEDVTEGPVLLVVTPVAGSGYDASTSFEEWLLVKGSTATVKTLYTDSAHDTWRKAVYINGAGRANPVSFDIESGFAVAVSSGDTAGALAAAAYAGMCKGPISTVSSDADYGFGLAWPGSFYSTGDIYGQITALPRAKKESDASLAASNYQAFKKNRSRWGVDSSYTFGDTAVLVNPAYIGDVATAAAAYSYAKAAPVFFTEKDGSLGKKTTECLADFKNVLVMGDVTMVSVSTVSAAQSALAGGGSAARLSGATVAGGNGEQERGNACSLSIAVAQLLMTADGGADAAGSGNSVAAGEDDAAAMGETSGAEGGSSSADTAANVAIIMASGTDSVADAVGALNFSGHGAGLTLAVTCSADAKRVASWLRGMRDDVTTVRLFGRDGKASGSFGLKAALEKTWDEKAAAVAAIGSGDELELYGTVFSIGRGGSLAAGDDAGHLWGLASVPAGSYPYGADSDGATATYTLERAHKVSLIVVGEPKAKTGLVYNARHQVGVAAGSGLNVKNGSGKDAGAYTAVVSPKAGYCWADGSNRSVRIPWSIATASLAGAKVTLGASKVHLSGGQAKCGVTGVTLANGVRLNADDYNVSYSSNTRVGTGTVKVAGMGSVTGSATARFEVLAAASSGSGDGSGDTAGGDDASADGEDDEPQTVATSDDSDDSGDGASADGWSYFAPAGSAAENQDTTMLGSVSVPPAVNIAILAICCLAFAAAIFYATHARKETDDTLGEEVSGE